MLTFNLSLLSRTFTHLSFVTVELQAQLRAPQCKFIKCRFYLARQALDIRQRFMFELQILQLHMRLSAHHCVDPN